MQTAPALRFHWSSYSADDPGDPAAFLQRCHAAEAAGFESIHVPRPECLRAAHAWAEIASRLHFRVDWDFRELLGPLGDRLILHMRVGVDDYPSAVECVANFPRRGGPAFDVEGDSAEAAFLAIQYADRLWRLPHRPNQMHADALPVLHFGKEVGIVSAVIARESREEALATAGALLGGTDPNSWVTPYLWKGTLPQTGETAAVLVGAFEQLATVVHGWKKEGISHFLLRELPGQHDAACFAARILPLIRSLEAA
jgi:hypothetical protein